jgi:hypothetical protein
MKLIYNKEAAALLICLHSDHPQARGHAVGG